MTDLSTRDVGVHIQEASDDVRRLVLAIEQDNPSCEVSYLPGVVKIIAPGQLVRVTNGDGDSRFDDDLRISTAVFAGGTAGNVVVDANREEAELLIGGDLEIRVATSEDLAIVLAARLEADDGGPEAELAAPPRDDDERWERTELLELVQHDRLDVRRHLIDGGGRGR